MKIFAGILQQGMILDQEGIIASTDEEAVKKAAAEAAKEKNEKEIGESVAWDFTVLELEVKERPQ